MKRDAWDDYRYGPWFSMLLGRQPYSSDPEIETDCARVIACLSFVAGFGLAAMLFVR